MLLNFDTARTAVLSTSYSIKADYALIAAVFLFHQHNSILSEASLARNKAYRYDSTDTEVLKQKVRDIINKTAFVFRNPAHQSSSSVIEFSLYSADDLSCVRLELTVSDHEYYNKSTYGDEISVEP